MPVKQFIFLHNHKTALVLKKKKKPISNKSDWCSTVDRESKNLGCTPIGSVPLRRPLGQDCECPVSVRLCSARYRTLYGTFSVFMQMWWSVLKSVERFFKNYFPLWSLWARCYTLPDSKDSSPRISEYLQVNGWIHYHHWIHLDWLT